MSNLQIGLENILESKVEIKDCAITYGSGNLNVYATPAMISQMEKAAFELAQEFMEFGDTTVGVAVDIKHLKASPVGVPVNTVARLIEFNDKKLSFEVEAYDINGLIGSGIHKRYIVNEIEFMGNL